MSKQINFKSDADGMGAESDAQFFGCKPGAEYAMTIFESCGESYRGICVYTFRADTGEEMANDLQFPGSADFFTLNPGETVAQGAARWHELHAAFHA